MAIACRRYKGEREAGCEQVIFYFNKIFLRHWLISIFIFFQSSTKRWLPLTYHQAYLRLCRTSVRVATALCAVDLKGSGGPGKGNVSVDWERSLKKEEKYFYINAKDGHCAPRLTLESPSCEHWIVTIFSASAMIVFVLYYLCVQSLVFRRAQGEERDGKKRKERIERQELKECGGVTSAAATRWVETQDSVLAAWRKSEDNELRRYNQAVAHVKSSQREVQKVNSNRLEREKSLAFLFDNQAA